MWGAAAASIVPTGSWPTPTQGSEVQLLLTAHFKDRLVLGLVEDGKGLEDLAECGGFLCGF